VEGDAFTIPLEEGSFDTVVLAEILEHLEEPGSLVKRAAGLCRPGGDVYITVPMRGAMPPAIIPGHVQDFTVPDVAALVESSGLEVRYAFMEHPFSYVYARAPEEG
jgi:SAM-dependent methyltransferase